LEFSNYAHVDVTRRGSSSSKAGKQWAFEYWGASYHWKRVANRPASGALGTSYSYHLIRGTDSVHPVAHILPEVRTPQEQLEERAAGGWVPPCSLWISDEKLIQSGSDVADVIVATGLIALVDDCYRREFEKKLKPKTKAKSTKSVTGSVTSLRQSLDLQRVLSMEEGASVSLKPSFKRQVSLPLSGEKGGLRLDMEFVSPREIMKHMFGRRNSADAGRKQREEERAGGHYNLPSPLRRGIVA
jgi:hypothetical protein